MIPEKSLHKFFKYIIKICPDSPALAKLFSESANISVIFIKISHYKKPQEIPSDLEEGTDKTFTIVIRNDSTTAKFLKNENRKKHPKEVSSSSSQENSI